MPVEIKGRIALDFRVLVTLSLQTDVFLVIALSTSPESYPVIENENASLSSGCLCEGRQRVKYGRLIILNL